MVDRIKASLLAGAAALRLAAPAFAQTAPAPTPRGTPPAPPVGIAVDTQRNRIHVALPALTEIIVYSREAPFAQLAVIH